MIFEKIQPRTKSRGFNLYNDPKKIIVFFSRIYKSPMIAIISAKCPETFKHQWISIILFFSWDIRS